MLAKQRCYTLQSSEHHHANIVINPAGRIEVDILENKQHVASEFEHVHFKESGQGVQVICEDDDCVPHKELCLTLSRRDAFELCEIIDDAIEEYEELMTDL